MFIGSDDAGIFFNDHGGGNSDALFPYDVGTNTFYNGHVDIGGAVNRFRDAHFSGTVNAGIVTTGGTVITDGSITDTGTFTLDVTGNIILDADNSGSIHLKDNNVQYGTLYKSGNNFVQYNPISDGDMILQGLDGASTINALTLDMSQAGRATFNEGIVAKTSAAGGFGLNLNTSAGDNMKINVVDTGSAGAADGTISVSDGDLTLDVAGDIILDAAGSNVQLKAGGTSRFNFYLDSTPQIKAEGGTLDIQNDTADADLRLRGNDNGTIITALTLDMSAAGAAIFNNNVTAYSDERLKENIVTVPDALEKVTAMRGVHYNRIDTGKAHTGVVAQEIQEIAPELVLTADDEIGTLSVDYGNITGYLIEAIKELKAEIEELKGK
jgi:hypothetical protein